MAGIMRMGEGRGQILQTRLIRWCRLGETQKPGYSKSFGKQVECQKSQILELREARVSIKSVLSSSWNWAWLQKGTNPWQEPMYMLLVGVLLRPAFFTWSTMGYICTKRDGSWVENQLFHMYELAEFSQSWWSILSPFLTWPLSSLCCHGPLLLSWNVPFISFHHTTRS